MTTRSILPFLALALALVALLLSIRTTTAAAAAAAAVVSHAQAAFLHTTSTPATAFKRTRSHARRRTIADPLLFSAKSGGDDSDPSSDDAEDTSTREQRLARLGYTSEESKRSSSLGKDDTNVRVDVVDNVDAFTLTAVGFALIAVNFFVFANLGDGGIGGLVATIVNLTKN